MTPEQCRAARAWRIGHNRTSRIGAHVGSSTVRDFEAGRRQPIANNIAAIRRVFEESGWPWCSIPPAGPSVSPWPIPGLTADERPPAPRYRRAPRRRAAVRPDGMHLVSPLRRTSLNLSAVSLILRTVRFSGGRHTQPLQSAGGKHTRPAWDRPNDGPEMFAHLRAVAFWAINRPAFSRDFNGRLFHAQDGCYARNRNRGNGRRDLLGCPTWTCKA